MRCWLKLLRNWLGILHFYGSVVGIGGGLFFSPRAGAATAPSAAINADAAAPRIEALRREIAHHDELYYKKAAPEISDATYDQLKQTLAALEQIASSLAAGESPRESLGDDRTGAFTLYRHRERMLSLDKCYRESDVRAFYARVAQHVRDPERVFVIEPKFDGLAVSVTYEQGRLVRAVTRGNGIEGDDVTANVLTIAAWPRQLRAVAPDGTALALPEVVELRGEIYLPLAEFARINREREAAGELPFAHPRNLAAGTLKLLDPREVAERKLAVVFYGWGAWQPLTTRPVSQQEFHASVRAWGLPGLERYAIAHTADEVWAAIRDFDHARPGLAFPVDGAVVKLDAVAPRLEIGATEHAPRWATAYKFSPERAETQVRGITVQVGRTGVLTPVAELAPVKLAGSMIARATLHNRDEITRQDIRVGDFVFLEKAGEIIPAIVGVNVARRVAMSRPYGFPQVCPACGTAVVSDVAAAVRCPNFECAAQVRRRLQYFASAAGVAIEGLGPALIDALVERGALKGVPDLYRLRRATLLALPGVGAKTADRVLASIERSQQAELWRFIQGLGLPQIGPSAAKALAGKFRTLDALVAGTVADFSVGLSAERAAGLVIYFQDTRHRAVITELLQLGVKPVAPVSAPGLGAGKIFVLTGTLPHYTRAQAEEKIIAAGGKVSGSVNRKTDYVVAGEGGGAKLASARALGIMVMDEAAWLRLLGEK
jgi:DNA ligase (NAD+)